jgi:hypothetical protein
MDPEQLWLDGRKGGDDPPKCEKFPRMTGRGLVGEEGGDPGRAGGGGGAMVVARGALRGENVPVKKGRSGGKEVSASAPRC